MVVLKRLAKEYDYFDESTRALGYVDVFNVTQCEVCGIDVLLPDFRRVFCSKEELKAVGMRNRLTPYEEISWSEIHEAGTCPECCYDREAGCSAATSQAGSEASLKQAEVLA